MEVARAVPGIAPIGETRAFTVELSRIPSRIVGKVVAPRSVPASRTITIPFAGAVKVMRRFVVSRAVIANRDAQDFDTAEAGS